MSFDFKPTTQVIERAMYEGEVVTVIKRTLKSAEIRDKFGFVHHVPKRKLKPLKDDDERAEFHA